MCMRLTWLKNARPDILHEISQLARVTEAGFKLKVWEHIKALKRANQYEI